MKNRNDVLSGNEPILAVVVPCFNEESVVEATAAELENLLTVMIQRGQIAQESRIVFVDDGSKDGTWEKILACGKICPLIEGIALKRNAGHQNALYAGLMEVKEYCDIAVSLDADLQDDPEVIPAMVEKFLAGNDIVYAVRKSRGGESGAKRISAFVFYRFIGAIGVNMPKDCGDFRLLSRNALEELSLYREQNPFLRGLIPLLGLPSAILYFDRRPRRAGKSKYSLVNMLKFAADGIVSLTAWPIYLMFWLGTGVFAAAFTGGLWLWFGSGEDRGWKIVVASIWAAAGLILMGIGTIGMYIFRIWQEESGRPPYRIRERYILSDEGRPS